MNYKVEVIGFFFSVLIAIIFWSILIVPARFFIALTIATIFFLTLRYVAHEEKEVNCILVPLKLKRKIFSFLVVLSTTTVLFVRPISGVEFVAWNTIQVPNILRLLLSSFLTLFFPGYAILTLLDRNETLTGVEKTFFAILLSLFIIPFLGLLSFMLGSSIKQLGISSIVVLNLTLLISYVLFKSDKFKANAKVSINLNEKLILISLFAFMSVLMLSKYSLNLTWDYGDLDIYYGYSLSFTKDVLPLSPIGPGLDYPFWPFIFFAECFILSGAPYANTFQFVSTPITFLPILSFYIMASAFFNNSEPKKIPIVATLLGFFGGGLGWIFGIHLLSNQTVQSLYELFTIMARTNSGYLIPSFYSVGAYPLYTYALTSIFALIWLIYSKRAIEIGNLRYILIPILIALGYLAHVAETVFFIFIFLTSILIFKREDVSSYRKCTISIIFGLLLVALPDIMMGGAYYTQGDSFTYHGFTLYYGTIVLAVLAFFLSFIKDYLKIPPVSLRMSRNKIRALRIAFSYSIIYIYALGLIIWSKVFETYNDLPTEMHTVPWYAWPNRLGISGLIALPGIIYLIHKNKRIKEYSFFIFLVPISFVIARTIHAYPTFYMEDRLTFFIMIPVVILASYALLKFYQVLKKRFRSNFKNLILACILLAVLVFGFLPALLVNEAVDLNYWSRPISGKKLSNSELDALNFLRLTTPVNASVLTLTSRSNRLLSYAGLFPVQTYVNRDPLIILAPLFPETSIYSLMKSQIKYLYLTSADERELEQNPNYSGFVKNYLLRYFPIAFQNDEVTIYEVPYFSIPTRSSTALVVPRTDTGITSGIDSERDFLSFSTVALSGTNYSTVLAVDPSKFGYATLILTRDINLLNATEQRDFQAYLNWINQGGRLIVLDSLGTYLPPEYRNLTLNDFVGWKDENFTRWTCQECFLSFDGNVMTIKTNNSDKNHDFISPNINVTVSGHPYVVIRWKTDGSPLYFYPHGTQSGYRHIKLGASTEWTTSVVNLKAFYDFVLKNNTGFKNNERIDKLLFRSFTENAAYSIKYVKFYKAYPLPVNPGFADLMSIYYTGKTVEADGIEAQTEYFKFPSAIAVSAVHSNDTNTKILAFFTMNNERVSPYAFAKKVGKGEVIYLAASSYFSAIENSTADVKRAFFKEMGSLLNIPDLKLNKNIVKWTNYFPQFDYIKEPVNLKGKIHVDTDYVEILKLNANDIAVLLTDESMKITNLNNSTMESIEYAYPIKFGIDAFGVNLSKTSFGRYLNIEIVGDFNLTMKIPKDSSLKMSVWNGTMLVNKVYQGETIQLSIRNNYRTIILVKNPTITIEGDAYFDRARIYRNYYKMPLFYDDGSAPFEVIGNTTFAIEYSDNGVSLVDNFTFNGEWFYPATEQKQSSFTEMDIPWPNVLTSPFHILLLITTFAALMVYVTLRRKKMKIRIKLMSP